VKVPDAGVCLVETVEGQAKFGVAGGPGGDLWSFKNLPHESFLAGERGEIDREDLAGCSRGDERAVRGERTRLAHAGLAEKDEAPVTGQS